MTILQSFFFIATPVPGQEEYVTPATHNFIVPLGITSISAVLIGDGAVRIIWGVNRSFPSTNTNDV